MIREEYVKQRRPHVTYKGSVEWRLATVRAFKHDGCKTNHLSKKTARKCYEKMERKRIKAQSKPEGTLF